MARDLTLISHLWWCYIVIRARIISLQERRFFIFMVSYLPIRQNYVNFKSVFYMLYTSKKIHLINSSSSSYKTSGNQIILLQCLNLWYICEYENVLVFVLCSVHEKNKKNKTEVHHLKRKRADYLTMLWRNLAHKSNEIVWITIIFVEL